MVQNNRLNHLSVSQSIGPYKDEHIPEGSTMTVDDKEKLTTHQKTKLSLKTEPRIIVENIFACSIHTCQNGES